MALSPANLPELYAHLQAALSSDTATREHAEAQLKNIESFENFSSCLAVCMKACRYLHHSVNASSHMCRPWLQMQQLSRRNACRKSSAARRLSTASDGSRSSISRTASAATGRRDRRKSMHSDPAKTSRLEWLSLGGAEYACYRSISDAEKQHLRQKLLMLISQEDNQVPSKLLHALAACQRSPATSRLQPGAVCSANCRGDCQSCSSGLSSTMAQPVH